MKEFSDRVWLDCGDDLSVYVRVGTPLEDEEGRTPCESYGFHMFAWRPVKCRNGRWRWLQWVERHSDGSFTKGR